MSSIKMNKFGIVLTGREYGMRAAEKILSENLPPFILDFSGVATMGSSFGDEIFKAVAKLQGEGVVVKAASRVVMSAIIQIEADLKAKFVFE